MKFPIRITCRLSKKNLLKKNFPLEKVMGIISRRLVTLDELARTSYVKEIIIKKYEPADLAFRNLGGLEKGSNVP